MFTKNQLDIVLAQQAPVFLTPEEKQEIAEKVQKLVNGKSSTVFFGLDQDSGDYFLEHVDSKKKWTFKKSDVEKQETQDYFQHMLKEAAGSVVKDVFKPHHLTVIDTLFWRISTSSQNVHDGHHKDPLSKKIPFGIMCDVSFIQLAKHDIIRSVVEDTFDNLTGKRPNW